MIVELLVRLKELNREMPGLLRMAERSSEWDSVTRVSAERSLALADACAAVRPSLVSLAETLEKVEVRARAEAKRIG